MYTIESEQLQVAIQPKGAELASIFHKIHRLEYLWNADPAFWAKKSPVLFPIVGTLKNNAYVYKGQSYALPRHGFARDKEFTVTVRSNESITFSIESNEATLQVFPFSFQFSIIYRVTGHELFVTYRVKNMDKEEMYFSVGGHPAFKVPLTNDTTYEDYELVFNKKENAGRWPISKDGLIEKEPAALLHDTALLPLTKSLFEKDALVLKHLQSDAVHLQSGKVPHGLIFHFKGFPFLGLWAAPGADFLCIEPWCGIADSVDSNQQLPQKEGIISLLPHDTFEATWSVEML